MQLRLHSGRGFRVEGVGFRVDAGVNRNDGGTPSEALGG